MPTDDFTPAPLVLDLEGAALDATLNALLADAQAWGVVLERLADWPDVPVVVERKEPHV